MHGTMMLFSIISLVGAVFIVCVLPETKGKTNDEILKLMGSLTQASLEEDNARK